MRPGSLEQKVRELVARDAKTRARLRSLETEVPWVAPTLLNSWVNVGGDKQDVGYRKIGDIVYLRGVVEGGSENTKLFDLPVGYRLPGALDLPASSWDGSKIVNANVYVDPNGSVNLRRTSGSGTVSFSCQFSVTP